MEEERVEGILLSKVSEACVTSHLDRLGVKVKKSDRSLEAKVALLSRHFANEAGKRVQCDLCDGVSPEELPNCPYCNDGNEPPEDLLDSAEVEDVDTLVAEEPAEVDEDASADQVEIDSPEEILAAAATYEEEPAPKKAAKPSKTARERARLEKSSYGLSELQTHETLDAAVAEVKRHVVEDKINGWRLGQALYEIYHGQMWMLRQAEGGAKAYRTWDQFLAAEVPEITTRYAWVLMKVSQAYTPEQFAEVGPKKLYATLAVDEVDVQRHLLEKAKGGASVKELVKEVRTAKKTSKAKKHPKDHSDTQRQKTGEKAGNAGKITVAAVLGKHSIPMHAGEDRGKKTKLATSVDDGPWCYLDLVNDVRAHFTVTKDAKGRLRLDVDIRHQEE